LLAFFNILGGSHEPTDSGFSFWLQGGCQKPLNGVRLPPHESPLRRVIARSWSSRKAEAGVPRPLLARVSSVGLTSTNHRCSMNQPEVHQWHEGIATRR